MDQRDQRERAGSERTRLAHPVQRRAPGGLSTGAEQPASRDRVEVFEETETQKGKQAQHTAVESVRRSPGRKRK